MVPGIEKVLDIYLLHKLMNKFISILSEQKSVSCHLCSFLFLFLFYLFIFWQVFVKHLICARYKGNQGRGHRSRHCPCGAYQDVQRIITKITAMLSHRVYKSFPNLVQGTTVIWEATGWIHSKQRRRGKRVDEESISFCAEIIMNPKAIWHIEETERGAQRTNGELYVVGLAGR